MPSIKYGTAYEQDLETKYEPQDVSYSEGVDFAEIPAASLNNNRCRSFRADILHKLKVIERAYGRKDAAFKLGVKTRALSEWMAFRSVPESRPQFDKIDSLYEISIEKLLLQDKTRKRK